MLTTISETGSSEYATSIQCTTNSNVYATLLQCDSSILQRAITITVLPKGYYSYKLQFMWHTVILSVILTIRVIIQLQPLRLTTVSTIAIL